MIEQDSGLGAAQAVLEEIFGTVKEGGYITVVEIPSNLYQKGGDWTGDFLPFAPGRTPVLGDLAARGTVEASNWYFSPVIYSSRHRTKKYVIGGATLWADFDTGKVDPFALPLKPSIVIESSPGRYHCFWLLNVSLSLGTLEYYNRRLASAFGADPSGWDANQLLRLPLGVNSKREQLTAVRLLSFDSSVRYGIEDLESLQEAPPDVAVNSPVPDWHDLAPAEGCADLETFQVWLRGKWSNLPRGILDLLEVRQADRSRALWYLFNECQRQGVPEAECFYLVLKSPNDKYQDLRTGKEPALWHDLLGGYAQAMRGAQDTGIIDKILTIRNGKGNAAEKTTLIGRLLVRTMAEEGAFYQTKGGSQLFYLDKIGGGGHLVRLEKHGGDLAKLVLDRYGLDPTGQEWASLFAHLAARAQDEVPVDVHHLSAYDGSRPALYINRYDTSLYLLEKSRIRILSNGTDGILFMDPALATPYTAAHPSKNGVEEAGSFWERLILPCANLTGNEEEIAIGRHIIYAWTLALFFPDLFAVKPILMLHGDPGSGKTMLFKALLKVLVGPEARPDAPFTNEDAFDTAATNSDWLIIDNADTYQGWLANKLAVVATSYQVTRRRLYSDNTPFTALASAFVGITSRDPQFLKNRQDVTERVLPMRVVPHGKHMMSESSLLTEINATRGALLAEIFSDLQHLLYLLAGHGGHLPVFTGDFRQADFAAWLSLTAPMKGLDPAAILRYIKHAQGQEVAEEDPLVYALVEWMKRPSNEGRLVDPRHLDLELEAGPNGTEYRKRVATPRALATRIGRLGSAGYLKQIGVKVSRSPGDSPQYAFEWIPSGTA